MKTYTAGVVLMSLGGGINTAVAVINTVSYMAEKRYGKAGWEAGGEVASALTGRLFDKVVTPSKALFNGYNVEVGKETGSFVAGEILVPMLEQTSKYQY